MTTHIILALQTISTIGIVAGVYYFLKNDKQKGNCIWAYSYLIAAAMRVIYEQYIWAIFCFVISLECLFEYVYFLYIHSKEE